MVSEGMCRTGKAERDSDARNRVTRIGSRQPQADGSARTGGVYLFSLSVFDICRPSACMRGKPRLTGAGRCTNGTDPRPCRRTEIAVPVHTEKRDKRTKNEEPCFEAPRNF